tara:strand:- start:307 stop:1614 length:1308 start_codon:yes stop_codon:yes gene_type:complete
MISLINNQLKKVDSRLFENIIFLVILLTVLLIGNFGIYDFIFILQSIFLFIFFNFKIKPLLFFINFISLIIVFYFLETIDTHYIFLSYFLFILSFDLTPRIKINISKIKLIFLTLIFSFLIIFLMKPYVKKNDVHHGYLFQLKIKETPNLGTHIKKEIYKEYLNNQPYLLYDNQKRSNEVFKTFCNISDRCEEKNLIKYNRYHFNGLDVNFSSLIFVIIFLGICTLTKNKNEKLLIITFGVILLYIFTKSRFLIPLIGSYYFFLLFEKRLNFKYFISFLISITFIYFALVYFFLTDYFFFEINKNFPIDQLGIIHNFDEFNLINRIFTIFHPSTFYKFRDVSLILHELIYNFHLHIFPNNNLPSNPHNIFLNLILKYGYLSFIILLFNILKSFKNKKFMEFMFPLIIGSLFLGTQILILSNLILIISNLKVKNNE